MTNDEISDIAWGIELGENRGPQFGKLVEEIKAGSLVKIDSDMYISKAGSGEEAAGILDKHYNVDLDTGIASGLQGHIINRGYAPVFCEDPTGDKPIGTPVFDGASTAGSACWAAGGRRIGTTVAEVSDGDTVALIYIDRG